MILRNIFAASAASLLILGGAAKAADPAACETVRLSDVGWTDITATTSGFASVVLKGLGYKPKVSVLSVPVTYTSLANGDIDVFLGNWMPSQQNYKADLDAANAAEVLTKNLTGAKFTLAVPTYVAEETGVTDFNDLAAHGDAFDKQIYGIEPGAPANTNLQKMIDADDFGLKDWRVVESSEAGMLAQVARAEKSKDAIVFLAWAPHPMNTRFDLTYLSGGDEYFGPDYGGAEVYTLARTGWSDQCPNAATFFRNLVFTIDLENEMMGKILDDGQEPQDAAKAWIKENPDALGPWLDGVTTLQGEPGLPVVKASLGLD